MSPADRVFLDAGLLIGALLADDPRHTEARGIVEAAVGVGSPHAIEGTDPNGAKLST